MRPGECCAIRACVVAMALVFMVPYVQVEAAGRDHGTLPRVLVDVTPGGGIVVSAPDLGPSDRIALSVPGLPAAAEPEGWRPDGAGALDRGWRVVRDGSQGAFSGMVVPVPPGAGRVLVSVYRRDDGSGDELQAHAWIGTDPHGGFRLEPAGASRVRNMVRLTLPEEVLASEPGLDPDPAGRVVLRASDPRVGILAGIAHHVETFVEAAPLEAAGIEAVGSVVGSNTWDVYFTDVPCTGTWMGSVIDITTAPTGTEVIGVDVDFTVYHSVDIGRFKSGLWHMVGSTFVDFVSLYVGQGGGANWLNRTVTNIHAFDGSGPNTQYILGNCNLVAVPETAYLDEWTITVFFTEVSSGIDLVAESASTVYSTVAAGGQLGYHYQGRVDGSGSVGMGFNTGIYLSADATITTGDRLLQTVAEPSTLTGGDTFGAVVFSRQLIVPDDVAPGSYWLGAVVDNANSVAETNEGNNTAATSITVASTTSRPNLVVSGCSVSPNSADPGDTVTLTYRAQNTGSTGAAYFMWSTFISSDPQFDGGDTLVAGLDVPGGWQAGFDSGTATIDIPLGSLSDGVYHVGFAVDSGNQVPETSETDNWCTAQVTVGSGGGGGGTAVTWIIPAAASAEGMNDSDWRSQISIVNAGTETHTANVYYVASGSTYPGVLLSGPISLSQKQGRYLDDPLAALRPTAGMIYVEVDDPDVVVTSRTFNRKASGERFGQGIPALSELDSYCEGRLILPLANTGPGNYHTNLGLVQLDSLTYSVEVGLYSPGGTLLALETYTQNTAFRQITDIFRDMGFAPDFNVEGAWISVRLLGACPRAWTAYLSVVDDTTGDPTYVGPVHVSDFLIKPGR